MTRPGEHIQKKKNSDPIYKLARGQEESFKKNSVDVSEKLQKKLDANEEHQVKDTSYLTRMYGNNKIQSESVEKAFDAVMEKHSKQQLYNRVYNIHQGFSGKNQNFKLSSARGARYMLDGESVLELDFGGTGATELVRGDLILQRVDRNNQNEVPPVKNRSHVNIFGRAWRFIMSRISGIWSTQRMNNYVDEHNEVAQENRRRRRVAYGQPVTLQKDGKRKQFEHIKRKDAHTQDATKTRYTMAGPNILNFGTYELDNLEEYALALGSEWLYPRLKAIADQVGSGEVPPETKKLHVMLQGHSRGAVAASMAAMRLNKWLYDNFEEKIAKLVQYDIIQYDPVPGKFSRTGIREKVDYGTRSYYDSDGNVTTDFDKAKYRSLGDQQNSTVIYSLRVEPNHFFTPQQVRGAKRIIVSVKDHSEFSYEKTRHSSHDNNALHRSPFLDLDNVKAFRGSGLNDMDEGLYIADDRNVLYKVRSLDEYRQMCKTILEDAPENVQTKRQHAIDQVAEAWFATHVEKVVPEPDTENIDSRLRRLITRQQETLKNMDADKPTGWVVVENDIEVAPIKGRGKVTDIDSFRILSREEFDRLSRQEQKQYKRQLKRHKERKAEAEKMFEFRGKEAELRATIQNDVRQKQEEEARLREKRRLKKEEKIKEAEKKEKKAARIEREKEHLRKDPKLNKMYRQLTNPEFENDKAAIAEAFLIAAANVLLEHEEFGQVLREKHDKIKREDKITAYKLYMAELGPDAGQEDIHKELELHETELVSAQEQVLISKVIKKELIDILNDIAGYEEVYVTVANDIQKRAKQNLKDAEAGWKEYETSLPRMMEMEEGTDYLDDYKDPLVQKQFRDEVKKVMKRNKLAHLPAEQAVLKRRREVYKTKARVLTRNESLVEVVSKETLEKLKEENILCSAMTDEDWDKTGGCSYNYVLNVKDAKRIEEKSGGFLAATRLKPEDGEVPATGVRVMRPSLPEKMVVDGEEISVRRNYNLVMKTYINLLTNPDGSYNTYAERDKITFTFERITSLMIQCSDDELIDAVDEFKALFVPKMTEILKEKYKGTEKELHAEEEAIGVCEDYVKMIRNTERMTLVPNEVAIANSIDTLNRLVRVRPDQLIAKIKEMPFTGRKPTNLEIVKAVESIYDDVDNCHKALKQIRDMDIDSKEVPIPNSCSANGPFVNYIQNLGKEDPVNNNGIYLSMYYIYEKPELVRQYLIKNMDILASAANISTEQKEQYLLALTNMNFTGQYYTKFTEVDKATALKEIDRDYSGFKKLKEIARRFSKYEYHMTSLVVNDKEDGVWTTEGFAAENTQVVVEPYTLHAGVGHYRGAMKASPDVVVNRNDYAVEGINNFYNKDNPFVSDMVSAIKVRIKELLIDKKQYLVPMEDILIARQGKKAKTRAIVLEEEEKKEDTKESKKELLEEEEDEIFTGVPENVINVKEKEEPKNKNIIIIKSDEKEKEKNRNQIKNQNPFRITIKSKDPYINDALNCYKSRRRIISQDEQQEIIASENEPLITVPLRTTYEYQDTNNCFACSGAALLNNYLAKKKNLPDGKEYNKYNQKDLRNIKPGKYIAKYDDVKGYFTRKTAYNDQVSEIRNQVGKGTDDIFGMMEMADFFLEADPEIELHDMNFTVSRQDAGGTVEELQQRSAELVAQKNAFKEKVTGVLNSGSPVSLFKDRHYITITGIKGNVVQYMDSLSYDSKVKPGTPVTEPSYTTISRIFDTMVYGGVVSLIWFGQRGDPHQIEGNYQQIHYDGTNFFSDDMNQLTFHVMRNKGVMGMKDLPNNMYERIYVKK